jgi:hypothetical protein
MHIAEVLEASIRVYHGEVDAYIAIRSLESFDLIDQLINVIA